MSLLSARKKRKAVKPKFRRQEIHRQRNLKDSWRRPTGHTSKLRRGVSARGAKPGPGYRSPAAVRGLNPKGLVEVLVKNVADIKKVDSKTQVAVIASGVGKKKRLGIKKAAGDAKIPVAN